MEVIEVTEREVEVVEVIERGPQGPAGTGLETLTTQGDMLYQGVSSGERLPIGTSGQILKVNSGATAPEWGEAPATGVTSVAVSGSDGIEVDSGSPITSSGTIALGVNAATLRSHINVADGAEVNVNADWDSVSGDSQILNKPTLATVATSGSYTDLANIPSTFTPASHTHGNITNAGAVGSTAGLPLKTGTAGVVEAGAFGTGAGEFCQGNDLRLSDARTPTSHTHTTDQITDITAFGALLVGETDAAGGRSRLGLGNVSNTAQVTSVSGTSPIVSSGGTTPTISVTTGTTAGTVATGDHTHTDLHTRSHAITSTSDHTAGTHKVFYSDGSGNITELALGAANTVLTSNGTAAAPSFAAASGGDTVSIDASAADVLTATSGAISADDGGTIDSADPFIKWNDTSGKLVYANPLSRPAGAMYVGVAPTTTALGTRAICIQADRAVAADRVPTGADSLAIGNSSQAQNTGSTAVGFRARANSPYAVSIGGESVATGNSAIAIGSVASASGAQSINISSYDAYFGNSSSATNSVGLNATADLRAMFATAAFRAVYWGGQTTDATANVELNLDATATNRMVIAANTAVIADIFVIARRTNDAANQKYLAARRWVAIRRDGSNNTALIGGVQTIETDQTEGSPTWTFTIDADDTASVESLRVRVTGASSETVNWRVCAIYRVVA